MLALSTETAKQYGIYAIVGVLVVGVLSAFIVRKVVGKIISLIITVALAATLFGQRSSIDDCVKKLRQTAQGAVTAGRVDDPTCTFFGMEVKVPVDKLQPTAGS
jgi:cobalamin biosynthesis protein CobD/CbiB